jgi:nucleoside-triphosphatase
MNRAITNILLTGYPGVGKTTFLRTLAEQVRPYRIEGFFTQEIREAGRRLGFQIETFDGKKGVLAHTRFRSPHRVGKYGVDVPAFEQFIEPLLAPLRSTARIFLIDEIGKMECFSNLFVQRLREILDSKRLLVATIARKGPPVISGIKSRPDVKTFEITAANRDSLILTVKSTVISLLD